MIELKTEHIDQIRNYFIASGEEEKLRVMNAITPLFLKGFLNDLRKYFILDPENDEKLLSIARSMGAFKHIESLQEIQRQYYSHLAEIYLSGQTNEDIEKLLEVSNALFLDEVAFQKETNIAIVLTERETLKTSFQTIEKESEISDEEITMAFEMSERARLKNLFKKTETEKPEQFYDLPANDSRVAESITEYTHASAQKIRRGFNWKRLAVAAGVVGLITTTMFIILNQDKKTSNVVANKPKTDKPIIDTNYEIENKTATVSPAISPIPTQDIRTKVLKQTSFGFAEKDEYIHVEVHYLNSYLKSFKDSVRNETDSVKKEKNKKSLDSLGNLLNKYRLWQDTLEVYIADKKEVKIFKVDSGLYFRIGKADYKAEKSQNVLPMKKVTDKQTLESIEKILFNEVD